MIFESSVEFNLDSTKSQINFDDIKSYLIQNYNGTLINLVLKDGRKFNVAANNTYCNTTKFDSFCIDFEDILDKFNEKHNLSIVRKKTFFERAWLLPFLIILTSALLIMIIHSFIINSF